MWLASARFKPLRHVRALPGSPDFVLQRRKVVIFVNGCFWHGHSCQRRAPMTNREYWVQKIDGNRRRDARVRRHLALLGWKSICVWECKLSKEDARQRLLKAIRKC